MSDTVALGLLVASQAAQWGLLIHHLLRCRDVRLDVHDLQMRERYDDERRLAGVRPIGRER